jgi:NTP pyrophosphatase (non-canonical NTP hydrolase)
MQCFGLTIARDVHERSHRFLEEALELVQANGCTASEAHAIVDYVYGRDQGDINQETGGVMVTLAALCLATGIDLDTAAEKELTRVWDKVETIRAKHFAKPKFSPLPMADDRLARVDGAIAQQLGESIQKNSALANRVTTLRSALATLKEGLIASAAIPDYCSTVLSSDDPEQHG